MRLICSAGSVCDRQQDKDIRTHGMGQAPKRNASENGDMVKGDGEK